MGLTRSKISGNCQACLKPKKTLFDRTPDENEQDKLILEGVCAICIDGHLSGKHPLRPATQPPKHTAKVIAAPVENPVDKLLLSLDDEVGVETYHDPKAIANRFGKLDCVKRTGEEDKSEIDYGSCLS